MAKLVLLEADGKTRDIRLARDRTTIGRRADNDVCLPFPAVSSEHAVVVTILSDSFLEDLGSTNGTLVNGRPIAKHLLRDRDRIDIGQQELVYLADEATTLEPTQQQLGRARAAVLGERVEQARAQRADMALQPANAVSGPVDAQPQGVNTMPKAALGVAKSELTGNGAKPSFALRVLTGTSADRLIPLVQEETIVGRAGTQVVAIHYAAGEMRVVPLEGLVPPNLNGLPLKVNGERLAPGDILEIAGTKIRVIALSDEVG